jgi:peptidoglycan/xylan/chitin deacetylase (PgdA/CDA1 family)
MLIKDIYYFVKPFIPRRLQLFLRSRIALRKRQLSTNIWPTDERTGKLPDGWLGWPEKKQFALVLTHDVETQKGQEKCHQLMKLEKDLGFRSSFNFVAEEYNVPSELRRCLVENGFEVGLHGLSHDAKLFSSKKIFQRQAAQINYYLNTWGSLGFRSPSMYHNLDWIHELKIKYDSSTFDTDPFEPQPEGVGTIFPFWVPGDPNQNGYVELPYTLPQDFTLFVLFKERNVAIWKKKLNWIAEHGGMALLITHPDYMNFEGITVCHEGFPWRYYEEFLEYIKSKYEDRYWHVLPKDMAQFWKENYMNVTSKTISSKTS